MAAKFENVVEYKGEHYQWETTTKTNYPVSAGLIVKGTLTRQGFHSDFFLGIPLPTHRTAFLDTRALCRFDEEGRGTIYIKP
jgi:hypothetical protein